MSTVDISAAFMAALAEWREAWRDIEVDEPSEMTEAQAEAIANRGINAGDKLAAAYDAYSTARTWSLPAEPGPEVTAVRDVDSDLWRRGADGKWRVRSGMQGYLWSYVIGAFAPLIDATAEVTDAAS